MSILYKERRQLSECLSSSPLKKKNNPHKLFPLVSTLNVSWQNHSTRYLFEVFRWIIRITYDSISFFFFFLPKRRTQLAFRTYTQQAEADLGGSRGVLGPP